MMSSDSGSIQLIDGHGVFNASGLDHFAKTTRMAECGVSYAVVSIMGPKKSGKSTLLNHLFGTNFRNANAHEGRLQTTKGVWLARAIGIGGFTLVMDLDDNDGTQRGEDDTAFEMQTTLFALAVSDIMLINMWCHDIGRDKAAINPLVKAVFQHVIVRLFNPRKTTLLFIIRDKTKRPLEKLERDLRKDIQKIWDNVHKPQAQKQTHFSEFFNVEVVALSSYEKKGALFMEEVANLRRRFHASISTGGLANDRRGIIPSSGFAFSAQQIWDMIRKNEDLDLREHKVTVAKVCCEKIANEKLSSMNANMEWRHLETVSHYQMVPGFGKRLSAILDKCLSGYDMEAHYFDEAVRTLNREQLVSKLLQIGSPAYQSMLGHIQSKTLDDFKEAFDDALVKRKEGFGDAALKYALSFLSEFDKRVQEDAAIIHADWDPSKVRHKLRCDIDAHVASVRATKLNELTDQYKAYLVNVLAEPISARLDAANDDTWPAIRELVRRETESYISEFSSALSAFDLDKATMDIMIAKLVEYAKGVVKSKAEYESRNILIHMKDRFLAFFSHNVDYKRGVGGKKEDIKEITKIAQAACLKLLTVMAAVRLDDQADNIEDILSLALADGANVCGPLDSNTWNGVSLVNTLISPVECRDLWRQFKDETENIVTSAVKAQEMEKDNGGSSSQEVNNTHQIAEMACNCYSLQLIDGDGNFNVTGLNHFVETMKMAERGLSYAVVSIMGPQSSGKSTLLNHLFGTNFREMNACKGRSQTTKGIWLARCVDIKNKWFEPFTVVMDLEGTDGTERGEDDTAFERQSALFALAVSDIVLINMWCHDIGREHAANKPLLKTVFQVMKGLFSPRKTTFVFVIRDKTKTPLESLERKLVKDIQEIWDNVPNPPARKETRFSEVFNMEVVALSSYEDNEDLFKKEVEHIRRRFHDSIAPDGLAGDRRGVVQASVFAFSAHRIWKVIKENKDLGLPAHKVMVGTVRCEEIANEKISSMTVDEGWHQLETVSQHEMVPGFGKKLSEILDKYLSGYDMESIYYDEAIRISKRKQLESEFLQIINPAYQSILGHIRSKTLDDFKKTLNEVLVEGKSGFADAALTCSQSFLLEFDRRVNEDATIRHANWDPSKVRHKLRGDIEAHVSSIRITKLNELTSQYKGKLDKALAEPANSLLVVASGDTWKDIRELLQQKTKSYMPWELSSALSEFDPDQDTLDKMSEELVQYAKCVVESQAKNEAKIVFIRMKDRFEKIFYCDDNSEQTVSEKKEDTKMTIKTARSACLKLLSVMAAIRWDDETDNIEKILSHALTDEESLDVTNRSIQAVDLLASNTWDELFPVKTLISPVRCKDLWRKFMEETEYIVSEAINEQGMEERGDVGSSSLEVTSNVKDESDESSADGENESDKKSADNFNHGHVLEGSPVNSIEKPSLLAIQEVKKQ